MSSRESNSALSSVLVYSRVSIFGFDSDGLNDVDFAKLSISDFAASNVVMFFK